MIAVIVTFITSALEIIDQLFGSELGLNVPMIEIALAVITPVLVLVLPNINWGARWPGRGA